MALEDDPDLAAGELALGLLEGEDLAAALRRVLSEPGFAMEVERWRLRLAALFDLWPAAEPPAGLARRIEASLDRPAAAPVRRSLWPILALASSALAACLLVFIVTRPEPVAPPPIVVASASPSPVPVPVPSASPSPVPVPAPSVSASPSPVPSSAPGTVLLASLGEDDPIAAAYNSSTGRLRLAAAPRTRGDRVAQLWVIGGDGVPYALALLGDGPNVLTIGRANRARIVAGATLAISIEPPGGSPEPKPTGPIVATGALERV